MKTFKKGDIVRLRQEALNVMSWKAPVVGIIITPNGKNKLGPKSIRVRCGHSTDTWGAEFWELV